jgi:hypothetical protein
VGAVIAGLLAAVLVGCGVPDSGMPVVDGTAGRPEAGEPEDRPAPPKPEDASNSADTVRLYFHAASGAAGKLEDHVKNFLSPDGQRRFRPSTSGRIQVIRLEDLRGVSGHDHQVNAVGQVVGELTSTGILLPVSRRFSHRFKLKEQTAEDIRGVYRKVWLIDNPPPEFLLSTKALAEQYDQLSLYFANRSSTVSLIPDLRYMPKALEWRRQRSTLVDWLLAGPSPRLSAVAQRGFPDNTKRRGTVYLDDAGQVVVVNLSSEAEEAEGNGAGLMLAQLVWTMAPRMEERRLQLRIEDRVVSYDERITHTRTDFASFNAVPQQASDAAAYYINKGRVARLSSDEADPPAVLDKSDYNSRVVSAALSQDESVAAVVRRDTTGWSLWLGRRPRFGDISLYRRIGDLPSGPIGRPVWAAGIGAGGSLLVTVAGALYRLDLRRLNVERVDTSPLRRVTAVSVAPDGFRIALVSGGRLYVAGLAARGDESVVEPLNSPVTEHIRHAVDVAWDSEHTLAFVDHAQGARELRQVNIDGLRAKRLFYSGSVGGPEQVAGYPTLNDSSPVLVTHDARVWAVYSENAGPPPGMAGAPEGSSPFFAF